MRVVFVALAILLIGSAILPPTDAGFFRRLRDWGRRVGDGLTNAWNSVKNHFQGVDWNDPSTYLPEFPNLGCSSLCGACNALGSSQAKSDCKDYCQSACGISVTITRDLDFERFLLLQEMLEEEKEGESLD